MTKLLLEATINSKAFVSGHSEPIITSFQLTLETEQRIAICAPSGAGKSTALRIIAGLDRDYSGHVELQGNRVLAPSARIQLVPQDGGLLPWKSVGNNIRLAMRDGKDDALVEDVLQRVGLSGFEARWPKTLSGGEIGRAAIARALVSDPILLLLDEPYRSVDIPGRSQLYAAIENARSSVRAALVLVTHDPIDAFMTCDKILFCNNKPLRVIEEMAVDCPRGASARQKRLNDGLADIMGRMMNTGTFK